MAVRGGTLVWALAEAGIEVRNYGDGAGLGSGRCDALFEQLGGGSNWLLRLSNNSAYSPYLHIHSAMATVSGSGSGSSRKKWNGMSDGKQE